MSKGLRVLFFQSGVTTANLKRNHLYDNGVLYSLVSAWPYVNKMIIPDSISTSEGGKVVDCSRINLTATCTFLPADHQAAAFFLRMLKLAHDLGPRALTSSQQQTFGGAQSALSQTKYLLMITGYFHTNDRRVIRHASKFFCLYASIGYN